MSEQDHLRPLQPGDRAPNVVLDAITREGQVAFGDFRGQKPVLIGMFRGLHCPFCRRHLAAQAQLDRILREKGIESLAVVNTPIERARLYFRYHPMPDLFAASDPERTSYRAFGLPNLEFTESETAWPFKVGMQAAAHMRVAVADESEPVSVTEGSDALNRKDGYDVTDEDQRMIATGLGQLFGQFLLDREGIVRWTYTEVPDGGMRMFTRADPEQLLSAAAQIAA
jgi:peroxiredoxin